MPQTPDAVLKDLKNNQYAPVYLLQGEESFYIDQISDFIEKNAMEESQKGFNQTVLYGKDADINTIIASARRFPMMAERQVVIVKEAQNMSAWGREAEAQTLIAYLENPQPSTVLVFCYKYKALDARKKISKVFATKGVVVTTKRMYDNQLPAWINNYAGSKGYKIDTKASHMLAESVGNNLERMANEIEKVLINLENGAEINAEAIQKYVGISKEYNSFELQNALVNKNVLKANQIIYYFESNPKANPLIPMIALLFSFYSKLLLLHASKIALDRDIASALKINPYFAKDYKTAMTNYSMTKVVQNIGFLHEADLRTKGVNSATFNDGELLKELIFKLLH